MGRAARDSPKPLPPHGAPHLARKFLYAIAAIILLILGIGIAYQLNPGWFGRVAFVPSTEFVEQTVAAPNTYDDPKMWFARPGLDADPSDWRPPAMDASEQAKDADGKLIPPAKAAAPADAAG